MYKQIIDYILYTFLRHKAVMCAKYQNRSLVNAQNNNGYMQVSIDTKPYFDTLISVPNVPFVLELNIDVMGFPKTDGSYTVLDAQNDAFQIIMEVINYIRKENYFLGQLAVRDYQIIGFDHYTDDNAAGERLTLQLVTPDPTNFCTFNDNFSDEFIPTPEPEKEIDITDPNPQTEINDLVLRPILLPTKS